MRTLYFDCFAGVSGDMTLGALISLGVSERELLNQLALLDVPGYEVEFGIVNRAGISAVQAHVRLTNQETKHRHLKHILQIIDNSRLNDSIKERARRIFTRLAEAEARVHNEPIERIHFHEVGALDAIIDVVGACIGFETLAVERFVASPLHVGSGTIEIAHGRYPVPPPAVAELLQGVPVYATDVSGELVTPTGAAIISTVCTEYGALPAMRLERTGYGAGGREYKNFPNVLRLMIGETVDGASSRIKGTTSERLVMIETNVDDLSPQVLGYVMERTLAEGALDCYFTSVQMKKNRPGVLVSVLCRPEDQARLCELLFTETTTLGVRVLPIERHALEREVVPVETDYGTIEVKVARLNGHVREGAPEYEQCRAAAVSAGVPLRAVEDAARRAYSEHGMKNF